MNKILFLAVLIAATAQGARTAMAQSNVLPGIDEKPTTGMISDEVARQRLQAAGVEQVAVLGRNGDQIALRGTINGNPVTLQMNALDGKVVDPRNPAHVIPISPATPIVKAPQIIVPRARLSDPALMRGVVIPRPQK